MKATSQTTQERLRRFLRWFFTVSPDVPLDPLPVARSRATAPKGRRQETPRLRAQHAGRVGISKQERS